QHVFVDMCFAQNNPIFCSAPITDVVSSQEKGRYNAIKQIWKEDYGTPVWSPDGKRIAFVITSQISGPNGYHGDIYVMNADGTNMIDLTPDEDNDGFTFAWSPDSRQIAFPCHAEQNLCIFNIDGSGLKQLSIAENTSVGDVAWSPDGAQIV